MKNTSELEALPRYVYGMIVITTVLALLLVTYLYVQGKNTSRLERRLIEFHLPTIVALNVIDRELNEIKTNILSASLSAVLQADKSEVLHPGSFNRYQASGHLHLINTRLDAVLDWQRSEPGAVFESTAEQLQASMRELESMLKETPGVDPAEANKLIIVALKLTQNRVEQLRRLHLKNSANLGRKLSLMEQSSSRNIGGTVVLALLIGGIVVYRLIYLLRRSLANKMNTDSELHAYRDHLEEMVAERSRELEASNRELESYSYSIAHDLRAPLRAVTSFSQILQEDAADRLDNDDKQSLERVIKAGKYMAQLIDDILELSRITRTKLVSDHLDLSRLARDIASRLDEASPDRRVEWRIHEGLKVNGSRPLLEVCLENLLGNAWKYTEKADSACIEFGAIKRDGKIVYFVKDDGIGFDMQYADKLFKPFQRLHKAQEYSGTGVGLATVERVIQRHGGSIWAESEEGKGATFLFTLS